MLQAFSLLSLIPSYTGNVSGQATCEYLKYETELAVVWAPRNQVFVNEGVRDGQEVHVEIFLTAFISVHCHLPIVSVCCFFWWLQLPLSELTLDKTWKTCPLILLFGLVWVHVGSIGHSLRYI